MNQRGFVLPAINAYGVMFGIIVALTFALTYSIHQTRSIQNEYDQYKAAVLAQQEKLKEERDQMLRASERVTADVSQVWDSALAYYRAHPRIVRVQSYCDSREMPGLSPASTGATGLHAGSGEGGISITISQCESLANDSLMDAAWINAVKRWTEKQHEVSK